MQHCCRACDYGKATNDVQPTKGDEMEATNRMPQNENKECIAMRSEQWTTRHEQRKWRKELERGQKDERTVLDDGNLILNVRKRQSQTTTWRVKMDGHYEPETHRQGGIEWDEKK